MDTRRGELLARFGQAAVDELRQTLSTCSHRGPGQIGYAVIAIRKPRKLTRQDGHRLRKDHP